MATPLPFAFLNGQLLPLSEARISPLDRGFLFGDAVYEVIPVYNGRPFLEQEHLARLERSLGEMSIRNPHGHDSWRQIIADLIAKNGATDMNIYIQVSRGAEETRNHAMPNGITPTIFMMATPTISEDPTVIAKGVGAITVADPRWKRCDIKSTALLGNVFAKTAAVQAHALEAILIADGVLREGASSSVLVGLDATLYAPPYGPEILPGTTRDLCLKLAVAAGIKVCIEPIPEAMLLQADELMLGFATRGVIPVTLLNRKPVGTGEPGPLWKKVYSAFVEYRQTVAHQKVA